MPVKHHRIARLIQRFLAANCAAFVVCGCAASTADVEAPAPRAMETVAQALPVSATNAPPSVRTSVDAQTLRAILAQFCAAHDCPGATFGYVLPDGRCGSLATGVSSRTTGRAMQPRDRMLMGSIGKTYVAAVALQLVSEGKLRLDTQISDWLSHYEWFGRLPNARALTLRQLLNHTSGIRRHLFTDECQQELKAAPQRVWNPEELIAFALDTEPLFPAGDGWSYSDTNYILVGLIIERVTRNAYYDELERRILRPQALDHTSPSDQPRLRNLISGYTAPDNPFGVPTETARDGRYAINPQFEWTGGGLICTALDLARWAYRLYGGHALDARVQAALLDGVATAPGTEERYGLGVMIRPGPHGQVYGHAGTMPGYLSIMEYLPEHDVALAVQVNTDIGLSLALLRGLSDKLAKELIPAR